MKAGDDTDDRKRAIRTPTAQHGTPNLTSARSSMPANRFRRQNSGRRPPVIASKQKSGRMPPMIASKANLELQKLPPGEISAPIGSTEPRTTGLKRSERTETTPRKGTAAAMEDLQVNSGLVIRSWRIQVDSGIRRTEMRTGRQRYGRACKVDPAANGRNATGA